jgi:tetratricopeptide (TPR) repeat protein
LRGFRKQVTDQKYLTIFSTLTEMTKNADGTYAPALTTEMVKQLGMGSDILVSLAMMDQKINDTYTVEIRRESMGSNVYREVDYFIGKRTVDIQFGWRVYDVKTGLLIDEYSQKEAYFYEAVSKVRLQATAILNNNFVTELSNLGYKYGAQYAARISPTTLRARREIYDTGSDALKRGAISAKAENWEEAAKAWQNAVIQEKKAKSKAKLYHNLAVNEERLGNMPKAREYAKLAAQLHPLGVKTQSMMAY